MRLRIFAVALIVLATSGCTSSALKHHTLSMAATLTDLQYQQVLNNIAMFKVHPFALPSEVRVVTGTATLLDKFSAGPKFTYGVGKPNGQELDASGERDWTATWGLTPVSTPDDLRRLQLLYRFAVAQGNEDAGDYKKMKEFYNAINKHGTTAARQELKLNALSQPNFLPMTSDTGSSTPAPVPAQDLPKDNPLNGRTDWIHYGKRSDCPADVYSGHYGETWVWVCRKDEWCLSVFTIMTLGGAPDASSPSQTLFNALNFPRTVTQ